MTETKCQCPGYAFAFQFQLTQRATEMRHIKKIMSIASTAFLFLGFFCNVDKAISQVKDEEFFASPHAQALIMLNIQGQTSEGQPKFNQGTAFFISKSGYALTAAHLFFINDDPSIDVDLLQAVTGTHRILGSIGSPGESPKIFELVQIDKENDVALIRLLGRSGTQQFLNICTNEPAGSEILSVIGFAAARGPELLNVKRIADLVEKRFPFSEPLKPGMDGAPIMNAKGAVFAMGVPGLRGDYQQTSYGVPMRFLPVLTISGEATTDCQNKSAEMRLENKESVSQARLDELLQEGEAVIDRDPATAEDKFEEAKALDHYSWRANYNLARIAFDKGDYAAAQQLTSLAIEHHPTDVSMYVGSALAKEGNNDLLGAEQDYLLIIANTPSKRAIARNALFSLGQVRLRMAMQFPDTKIGETNLENAQIDFIKYLQSNTLPRYLAWYHLACISSLTGDKDGAKTNIEKAWQALRKDKYVYRTEPIAKLKQLLSAKQIENDSPGEAVDCPELKRLASANLVQTEP